MMNINHVKIGCVKLDRILTKVGCTNRPYSTKCHNGPDFSRRCCKPQVYVHQFEWPLICEENLAPKRLTTGFTVLFIFAAVACSAASYAQEVPSCRVAWNDLGARG